ncbi:hypothetical protein PsorP6_001277 [Peronosclerospora sorghi]|uniref:Uncharacterized protein n=1 Tax=Peronosclerospora sorghi TaxID=230839 RepID=A0ACC0WWG1_9STRA|nr:hypothetical protein PsorP6_001277 [Peronosclerospora sorghi]
MASQVALKIAFNGDIHRTRVDLFNFSLHDLTQIAAQTFCLPVESFVLQYRDPEGDRVNVTTEAEFQEAVYIFRGSQDSAQSLKFSVLTKRQAEFEKQVADPLVASVEQLMQALAVALEKLKHDANFVSCAASDTNVKLDQDARENAESPKTAASGFSSFAQGLVVQINRFIPEKKAGEATAAPSAMTTEEDQRKLKISAEVPTVLRVEKAPPAQETEEMPSTVSSVAFSEAELRWAEQLSIVSGIFPNVTRNHIIEVLEKSDGDLNVVLNVLTEEN